MQAECVQQKVANISDDEDEDVVEEEKFEDVNDDGHCLDDQHNALKIVLQRQFFEAVARAAFVKYASGSDCGSSL